MTPAAVHRAAPARAAPLAPASTGLRTAAARVWLAALFWHAAHAPWVLTVLRPVLIRAAWHSSRSIRAGTTANAARLLGPGCTDRERAAFGRAVVARFFDAVVELGRNRRRTREQIRARVSGVEGMEGYERARALRRGAILVTAHLGSFETALSTLCEREPRVHVVFRRDEFPHFEHLRAEQRRRFGVIEAPVDDGLTTWFRLRDALLADEVVLMQGDRVMPGQRGVAVPFLGGRMRVPTGPVKLAQATGAPIVPVFAPADPDGGVRVIAEDPIVLEDVAPGVPSLGSDAALLRIVGAIERHVRSFPDQWLMLSNAWCDDPEARS